MFLVLLNGIAPASHINVVGDRFLNVPVFGIRIICIGNTKKTVSSAFYQMSIREKSCTFEVAETSTVRCLLLKNESQNNLLRQNSVGNFA